MWISRKDFIVLPYLCSQEYMVERRAYHLSQKKTHQKIARFRSVSVKRKERPLIEGLGVQKQPFKAITWEENITIIVFLLLRGGIYQSYSFFHH